VPFAVGTVPSALRWLPVPLFAAFVRVTRVAVRVLRSALPLFRYVVSVPPFGAAANGLPLPVRFLRCRVVPFLRCVRCGACRVPSSFVLVYVVDYVRVYLVALLPLPLPYGCRTRYYRVCRYVRRARAAVLLLLRVPRLPLPLPHVGLLFVPVERYAVLRYVYYALLLLRYVIPRVYAFDCRVPFALPALPLFVCCRCRTLPFVTLLLPFALRCVCSRCAFCCR